MMVQASTIAAISVASRSRMHHQDTNGNRRANVSARSRVFAVEETPLLGPAVDEGHSEGTLVDGGEDGEDEVVDTDKANQHVGRERAVFIVFSLWGLIFLQASNLSLITTTQSVIAAELDAFEETSWFTSAYLISTSSIAPLVGRLAQVFSTRSCILASAFLFSIGGLVTSQAGDLKVFLIGRTISGAGGAGILAISLMLVLELSGKKKRGLFIGLANTGFTTGVALGAVIAGALVHVTGWRFLFFIQAPLAFVAGTGVYFSIPSTFTTSPKGSNDQPILSKLAKIDYLGAVSLTSSIVLFLFGLSWPQILLLPMLLSFLLLVIFILNENYLATDPIIPISVLKSRGALLSCVAQLGIMNARWMVLFYTPVYAIAIRGWDPATAGSILIPTNLGFALGGILTGWLHIKRTGNFWTACVVSYTLFTISLFTISQLSNPTTSPLVYILATFINGFCTGSAINYTLAHLLHLTPPSTHFIVTSLLATFRGFAGSFGSAIGGGLFARMLKGRLEEGFEGQKAKTELVRRLLGSPALVKTMKGYDYRVAVAGYEYALKGLFVVGTVIAAIMVVVQAGTGWEEGSEEDGKQKRAVGREDDEEDEEEEEEEEEEALLSR